MGCGASKESAQSAVIDQYFSSNDTASDKKRAPSIAGECSHLRGNDFDCDPDPGDESSSAAAISASKAVSLIIRTCSPEPESTPPLPREEDEEAARADQSSETSSEEEEEGNYGDEDDVDGDVRAHGGIETTLNDEDDHQGGHDLEEDGSSETIVSPAKSPDHDLVLGMDPDGKDQGGDEMILPKAAAAALEAIVKSAEDDVQAMKVVAAVAAVGDILFGGKEEAETKIEKCQSIVKTLAEVDVNTINEYFKSDHQNFRLSETPMITQQPDEIIDEHNNDSENNDSSSSPKSSFLFDYCQKLSNYRISPPSTASAASSSEADTLSMVQDFLEEIDLTRDYVDNPLTPRVSARTKNAKAKYLTFSDEAVV